MREIKLAQKTMLSCHLAFEKLGKPDNEPRGESQTRSLAHTTTITTTISQATTTYIAY